MWFITYKPQRASYSNHQYWLHINTKAVYLLSESFGFLLFNPMDLVNYINVIYLVSLRCSRNYLYWFTTGVLADLTKEILPGSAVSCSMIACIPVISAAFGSARTCNLWLKLIIISSVWSGRRASTATKPHLTILDTAVTFSKKHRQKGYIIVYIITIYNIYYCPLLYTHTAHVFLSCFCQTYHNRRYHFTPLEKHKIHFLCSK